MSVKNRWLDARDPPHGSLLPVVPTSTEKAPKSWFMMVLCWCRAGTMSTNKYQSNQHKYRNSLCLLWFLKVVVRKGGFEPPRLTAPPPQDGASASSATSARGKVRKTRSRPEIGRLKLFR